MADTKWQAKGLCTPVQKNYDPWFSDEPEEQMVARAICMSCPVRAQCVVHSLVNDFEYGIFGGLSPKERKPLREKVIGKLDGKIIAGLEDSYLVTLPNEDYVPPPSVGAKYSRRHARAEMCYDELTRMDPNDVPHYDMYVEVLRAVLENPFDTGEQLGKRIGRSPAMFNQRLRECFNYFNVDLSVL